MKALSITTTALLMSCCFFFANIMMNADAFSIKSSSNSRRSSSSSRLCSTSTNTQNQSYEISAHHHSTTNMSTTVAPPREKTDTTRKTGGGGNNNTDDDRSTNPEDIVRYNDAPMEYLEDEWSTRNPDDPFHILLLDTTFTQNDRVTIPYVAGCLTYVLGMPETEATDLSKLSMLNGFSCLGTWEREECLKLGRQLQIRDCVVRVVPFVEGGSRGWQAKDASSASSSGGGGGYNGGGGDYYASGGGFFE